MDFARSWNRAPERKLPNSYVRKQSDTNNHRVPPVSRTHRWLPSPSSSASSSSSFNGIQRSVFDRFDVEDDNARPAPVEQPRLGLFDSLLDRVGWSKQEDHKPARSVESERHKRITDDAVQVKLEGDMHASTKLNRETHSSWATRRAPGLAYDDPPSNGQYDAPAPQPISSGLFRCDRLESTSKQACNKQYIDKSGLQRHINTIHTGTLSIRCQYCDILLPRKDRYPAHLRLKHPEAASSASGGHTAISGTIRTPVFIDSDDDEPLLNIPMASVSDRSIGKKGVAPATDASLAHLIPQRRSVPAVQPSERMFPGTPQSRESRDGVHCEATPPSSSFNHSRSKNDVSHSISYSSSDRASGCQENKDEMTQVPSSDSSHADAKPATEIGPDPATMSGFVPKAFTDKYGTGVDWEDPDMKQIMSYHNRIQALRQKRKEDDARARAKAQDEQKRPKEREEALAMAEEEAVSKAKQESLKAGEGGKTGDAVPAPSHRITFDHGISQLGKTMKANIEDLKTSGMAQAKARIEDFRKQSGQSSRPNVIALDQATAILDKQNKVPVSTSTKAHDPTKDASDATVEPKRIRIYPTNQTPIAIDKITNDDWLLFNLGNQGYHHKQIAEMWPSVAKKQRCLDWYRDRYKRMKATFPDLTPADLRELSDEETKKKNLEIAAQLQKGEDVTKLLAGDQIHIPSEDLQQVLSGFAAPAAHAAPEPRKQPTPRKSTAESRPTTGGKSISEDLAAYLLSTLEQDEDDESMDTSDDQVQKRQIRAASPPAEDDVIHFGFRVLRRTVRVGHEAEICPWLQCGEEFDNLTDANLMANAEMQTERDAIGIWPLQTWEVSVDQANGTLKWHGKSAKGDVDVKVERFQRLLGDGIQPKKVGWASRVVYDVKARETRIEEIESWHESELSEPISATASFASSCDVSDAEGEVDDLFGENEDDSLTTSFDASSTSSAGYNKRKRDLMPENTDREEKRRKIDRTQRIERTTTVTTSDVGSVFGSRNRANREAAKHFVKLEREMHSDPEMRRPTVENGIRWKQRQDELEEYCDGLEEEGENFSEMVESEPDDADVTMGGTGEGEGRKSRLIKLKVEVFTQERRFENPRNLF